MEIHIMRKVFFLLIFLNTILFAQPSGKAPNWDAWNFLMGEWKGEGGGDPGQGTGTFSFAPDLDYTILTRKNHTVYPAAKNRPAFSHDDLMTIYQTGNTTRAIYFDNEGHTINYTVEFSQDSNAVIFLSDLSPSTPRFRLMYTKVENETVRITFEIAPPGKPETFSTYLEGFARRTRCVLTDNPEQTEYAAVEIFDPKRDAAKDISDAIIEATKSNRRIILDVGGNWCVWCRRLDSLFTANQDLDEFMHKNYVVVKVNFSKENENEKVLSRYPEIKGYPHLFVLDKDGKLIYSQDTGDLESGKGHSREKVFEFLKKWSPLK
jgi:thioredoxin-related protein